MSSTGLIVSERMALVRDGLVSVLRGAWTHGIVRSGATLEETSALLAVDAACVLLLDAGQLGPSELAGLRQAFPSVRIVVLASEESRDGALQCLSAGAQGYIAKSASFAELLQALETVRSGGVHVPAGLAATEYRGGSTPSARVEQLTGRQRDVLMLMAEGRSTKDIARTLDLAVSTIKVHLAGVYRAVGARNRVEALCRAGLLPERPFAHSSL